MQQTNKEILEKTRNIMESDFDIEKDFDFEFKPITKGLGFHHKERSPSTRSASTPQKVMQSADIYSNERPLLPSEIAALHGAAPRSIQLQKPAPSKIVRPQSIKHLEADPVLQSFAFLVDLVLVITLSALTLSLFAVFSPFPFNKVMTLLKSKEMQIWVAGFISLFYISYFSFLEVGATPGKTFFGMKTVNRDGSNITLLSSFSRTLVSLFSFLAIGVPFLFDFQGKLSDSIVIRK